jgi:hypothetical protein
VNETLFFLNAIRASHALQKKGGPVNAVCKYSLISFGHARLPGIQVDVTGAERLPEHLEFNLQLRHAPTGLRQELIIRYMPTRNTESNIASTLV